MTKLRFQVDFNELIAPDIVLLSQKDQKQEASGHLDELRAGLNVEVYEEDIGIAGESDELFAQGTVEKNTSDGRWAQAARWVCCIDENGIRHRSDVA